MFDTIIVFPFIALILSFAYLIVSHKKKPEQNQSETTINEIGDITQKSLATQQTVYNESESIDIIDLIQKKTGINEHVHVIINGNKNTIEEIYGCLGNLSHLQLLREKISENPSAWRGLGV